MTDRELMQEALYALTYVGDAKEIYSDTIESLRARLAQPEQEHSEQWWKHEVSNAYANGYEKGRASVKQPEQEPVAWIYSHKGQKSVSMNYVAGVRAIPLYTAQPQREATQEPAAYMDMYGQVYSPHELNGELRIKYLMKMQDAPTPLYYAPPQRDEAPAKAVEWQGLTDEEILEEYRQSYGDDGNLTDVYFAHAIEAKLKEKNA